MAKLDRELFDPTKSSSDILRKRDEEERKDREGDNGDFKPIESWDDFFAGLFEAPCDRPAHSRDLMRRHLPVGHPNNPFWFDLQIPYMFSFDDTSGNRWFGYIIDTGTTSDGWKFLLGQPDRDVFLSYLAGEETLNNVYRTIPQFYVVTPDVSPDMIKYGIDELPDSGIPAENSYYTTNMWFDTDDLEHGMNVSAVEDVQNLARQGRFY